MAVSFTNALGVILVAASGAGLVVQNGMNATLGTHVGNAFAGVMSFVTGMVVIVAYFLIDVYGVGSAAPALTAMRGAPWWTWIGGTMGAFYVCCAIVFAQPLGAGTLTAVSVTAQLLAAILFDAGGILGFQKRRVHWARLLGACLLVVGMVLMTVFRGEAVQPGGEVHSEMSISVKVPANSSHVKGDAQSVDQHVVDMSSPSSSGGLPAEWP